MTAAQVSVFPDANQIQTGLPVFESDPALKQEVFDMLVSGWSPARLCNYLARNRGISLTVQVVYKFLDQIPLDALLPPSSIRTRAKNVDVRVDALGEMQRLLHVAEERAAAALLVEELTDDQDSNRKGVRKVTVEATALMREYWDMLKSFVDIQQSVGDLARTPVAIDLISPGAGGGAGGTPSLRDLIESRTNAQSLLAGGDGEVSSSKGGPLSPPVGSAADAQDVDLDDDAGEDVLQLHQGLGF